MANYAASVLAEAQLKLMERYAAPEKRLKSAGVLGAFLKNSSLAMPNIGALRTKEQRAEKAYFANRSKRSVITSRTFNHTGVVGDSTEVALAWSTFGDKAQTSLKRSDNNIFTDAELLADALENMFKNIYEGMDASALAYLATNKTGVNIATKGGTFNATFDAFQIATADVNRFIQHGKSMLRQNYYTGAADVILDPLLYVEAEFLAQQGGANSTNYGFQFSGVNVMESVQLADANYALGAGYFIPEGTIGVVDWIPSQNRSGYGVLESSIGGFSSIVDPISGLTFALHGYQQRADTSASGGDTQDVVMEWEVSVDLSFNNSPLSVATESTIFETGVVA
jgi:hypothetical protein